jgi:hypothetical protein
MRQMPIVCGVGLSYDTAPLSASAPGQPMSVARLIPGAIKLSNASAVKMGERPHLMMHLPTHAL